LQHSVAEDGDTAVVAVSYDPVEILAEFAGRHGITFPLLSDVGSRVIAELGMLNTSIAEDQAAWGKPLDDRHRGLPFPGTVLLDGDGIVVGKVFERSHRVRPTGGLLLELMQGPLPPPETAATLEAAGTAVAVWSDPNPLFPGQVGRIRVRLRTPVGSHVYVGSNPPAYTCVSVEVEPREGVNPLAPMLPVGERRRVDVLDEEWTVADGDVDVTVPLFLDRDVDTVETTVTVRFQVCTDHDCLPPVSVSTVVRLDGRGE